MPQSDPPPTLLSPIFESAVVRAIFSDRAMLQAMLDFEAALAGAEADAGVIPAKAAPAIRRACQAENYDIAAIGAAAALSGAIAVPLVKALTERVSEEASGYVHWGATSQDAIDTAFMLCAKRGLSLLSAELRKAMLAAIALAEKHRGALMAGRTLLQQALPITFGHKAAVWLSGLCRARSAIRAAARECLAVQFGGAAGTLAALGGEGVKVRAALAGILELPDPGGTWHAERSRIFGIAAALAQASGAAAKIATDIALLMQSEVGEAFEPAAEGKGGSSAMPHKRNPVGSIAIRANHRRVGGLIATMTLALDGEHERAAGAWAAEWQTMRDLFRLAAGSVERLADMLTGLEVDTRRMRENLDCALGLPLAESLMMALAKNTGRGEAKRLVEAASKRAIAQRRPLAAVAGADAAISAALSNADIAAALDPKNYLGSVDLLIEASVAESRREMEND
jgi:3-carboxy-cis,cis-muconate cycloisomerase